MPEQSALIAQVRRGFSPRGADRDARLLLIIPAVTFLLLAFLGPLLILLGYSVGILESEGRFHLQYYYEIATDSFFRNTVVSTLSLAFSVTIATLFLGYPIAWIVARSGGRLRTTLIAILIAPLLTNIVVRTLAWIVILSQQGYLSTFLRSLRPSWDVTLLGSVGGVRLALIHIFLPFMVLPMVSTLERISPAVREAALAHGAHPIVSFWRIIVPLSMPGIVAGSTIVFLLSAAALVTPFVIGQQRVWVLTTLIFQQIQVVQWGRAGALAVTMLVIATAVIGFFHGVSRRMTGHRRSSQRHQPRVKEWRADLRTQLSRYGRSFPSPSERVMKAVKWAYVGIFFAFVLLPLAVIIKGAFDAGTGISARWHGFTLMWFENVMESGRYFDSFSLSARLAATVAIVAFALALPATYGILRGRFRGRGVVLAFLMSPLTIPNMVLAVGFVLFFVAFSVGPSFSRLAVVHAVLVLPFAVRILASALEDLDPRLEESARTLGAGPLTAFRRVTLPSLKPAILAAIIFAFLVSFDEATVTVLVGDARNVTLPVRMFSELTQRYTPTLSALATMLVVFSIGALVVLNRLIGVSRIHGRGR